MSKAVSSNRRIAEWANLTPTPRMMQSLMALAANGGVVNRYDMDANRRAYDPQIMLALERRGLVVRVGTFADIGAAPGWRRLPWWQITTRGQRVAKESM
jgi:hypothetical protein